MDAQNITIRINTTTKTWATYQGRQIIGVWTSYEDEEKAEKAGRKKARLMGFDDPIVRKTPLRLIDYTV